MTTLILVRHGESEANEKNIFVGQTDVELTTRGIMQAERTADFIKRNFNVDAVYASDLKRAYKTARALGDKINLEVVIDKGLREIFAGEWEGVHLDDIGEKYQANYSVWLKDIGNAVCTGGESVCELGDRVRSTIQGLAEDNIGKTIVIATHATPIRILQCLWENKDLGKMKDIPWVTNASITVVNYEDNKYSMVSEGYDAHLAELKTPVPDNL